MKRALVFFCFLWLFFPDSVFAADPSRSVTIVHPVRSRAIWKKIEAMENQILAVTEKKLPVTWLIQYDVLSDGPVIDLLKKLPSDHEIGIFLEVDETLARDALVPYILGSGDRARADKVLLSGYEPAERKRMIDRVFTKFSDVFGYQPVSVGAWYVDALSSEYLSSVYGVKAIMDCSDQFSTDGYGLWGQPWGTAYYSSRLHPLVPASSVADTLPVVRTQWAARDSVRGYGHTVADSIYSVQANDYAGQGLTTGYFEKLLSDYLRSPNTLNNLTVGIEVGQEGLGYQAEYRRQMETLAALRDASDIEILTMKQFSDLYRKQFPGLTPEMFVYGADYTDDQKVGYWYTSPQYRVGLLKDAGTLKIRDLRPYTGMLLDEGAFQKDTNHTLKRIIPAVVDESGSGNALILLEDAHSVSVRRDDQDILLQTASVNGVVHVVVLKPEEILLDGKSIWSVPQENVLGRKIRLAFLRAMLSVAAVMPHQWTGGIRFSSIEGTMYAGLWLDPEYLYGVSTRFPYVGKYYFPFSALSHFRSPPSPRPALSLLRAIR